jgi:hypothetical protein
MNDLLSYTSSAFGYDDTKPPLAPSRSGDSSDDEAIEAYRMPILPSSPRSTMDIEVITCVNYYSQRQLPATKDQQREHIFKPIGSSLTLSDGEDDAEGLHFLYRSKVSTFDCSEHTDDDDGDDDGLLGLQFLELEDELYDESDGSDETECMDVGYNGDIEEQEDLMTAIFDVGAKTLGQLGPSAFTECFFPQISS